MWWCRQRCTEGGGWGMWRPSWAWGLNLAPEDLLCCGMNSKGSLEGVNTVNTVHAYWTAEFKMASCLISAPNTKGFLWVFFGGGGVTSDLLIRDHTRHPDFLKTGFVTTSILDSARQITFKRIERMGVGACWKCEIQGENVVYYITKPFALSIISQCFVSFRWRQVENRILKM